ncbi:MAG: hypothetical protein HY796_02650 [Elusimicrobia bacterium]|nr:hypothetical protein [Elusimicrobiota bacterium]
MSDLPEINFKEKKEEKKKGFIPWIRSKLGIGGRNAVGGAGAAGRAGGALPGVAGIGSRAALGRAALGAGRFGSASGGLFGGLLSGNMGLLLTAAVVAVALGTGIYMSGLNNPGETAGAFGSNKSGDGYVPAIMRNQQSGSSLDMFKDANKAGLGLDGNGYDANGYDKDGYDKDGYDKDGYDRNGYDKEGFDRNGYDKDGYDRNGYDKNGLDRNGNPGGSGAASPGGPNAGQDMAAKLAGGFGSGLSGSMGSGGNKFSNMGGFGNKFSGNKVGFGKVGSGFSNLPEFNSRKKLLAMKGSARAVPSSKKGAAKYGTGTKAWGQSKGLRLTQKSDPGYSIDTMRGTQDAAWVGSTPDGTVDPDGGTGVTTGGTSPPPTPYDTPTIQPTGGGTTSPDGTPDTPLAPDATHVDSEFESTAKTILMLITVSIALALVGAMLINAGNTPATFYLKVIGMILCGIALALAIYAGVMAVQLMGSQMVLGIAYLAAAGLAGLAAGIAMFGNMSAALLVMIKWVALAAGVVALMGAMLG